MSALHDACEDINLPLVLKLLAEGLDPNERDQDGYPPLHLVASYVGERLNDVERGDHDEDVDALVTTAGRLMSALLAAGCAVAGTDDEGDTALHCSAEYYGHRVVALLIDVGVPLETRGKDGDTAFIRAAKAHTFSEVRSRKGDSVQLLSAAGADVNAVNDLGDNAFHFAACTGDPQTVEALCSLGVDYDQQDESGFAPLHWACQNGHVEITMTLLTWGASPNLVTKRGRTPMVAAAEFGSAACVGALLGAGASPGHVDNDGHSALTVAQSMVGRNVVSYLTDQLLAWPDSEGKIEIVFGKNDAGEKIVEVSLRHTDGSASCRTLCDHFGDVVQLLEDASP